MPNLDPALEQLLSSYLDGAVTQEQRARVESLLQSDPTVAADLAEMRELGEQLRRVARTSHRLPAGFADRVIESATERARLEGCDDGHPLLRAATQPARRIAVPPSARWTAAAAVAFAVAASIALFVVRMPPPEIPVARNEPAAERLSEPSAGTSPEDATSVDTLADNGARVVGPDADATAPPNLTDNSSLAENSNRPENSRFPGDSKPRIPPGDIDDEASASVLDSLVGGAKPSTVDLRDRPAAAQSILVLDIRLVDARLGLSPIREAMQKARVAGDSEQPLDQAIVGAIASAVEDPEASGSLMYLRAPAKQLDRFIMNLLDDRRQVAGVGLSLAQDAPVLRAAGQFARVDSTTVRHDFASLIGEERSGELGNALRDRPFLPLRAGGADGTLTGMLGTAAEQSDADGPDVMSDVFLLVR